MQPSLQMLELQILVGCCLLSPICSSLSLPYDPLQLQDVSIEENAIDDVGRELADKAAILEEIRKNGVIQETLPNQNEQHKQKFAYRPWELEYYKTKDAENRYQHISEQQDEEEEGAPRAGNKNQVLPKMYMSKKEDAANTTEERHHMEREMGSGEHAVSPDVSIDEAKSSNDIYFIVIVAACSAAAVVGVVAAGICWYRFQKNVKATADAEYPAYGVTGPTPTASNKDVPVKSGDRKLAQYAHMYHYQHQKQQMIAMESKGTGDRTGSSDIESDEDNGENDDTVYECPGLAPTGELEVKNPLFEDEPTPLTPAMKEPPHK